MCLFILVQACTSLYKTLQASCMNTDEFWIVEPDELTDVGG